MEADDDGQVGLARGATLNPRGGTTRRGGGRARWVLWAADVLS